jgi:hypothetical protein
LRERLREGEKKGTEKDQSEAKFASLRTPALRQSESPLIISSGAGKQISTVTLNLAKGAEESFHATQDASRLSRLSKLSPARVAGKVRQELLICQRASFRFLPRKSENSREKANKKKAKNEK